MSHATRATAPGSRDAGVIRPFTLVAGDVARTGGLCPESHESVVLTWIAPEGLVVRELARPGHPAEEHLIRLCEMSEITVERVAEKAALTIASRTSDLPRFTLLGNEDGLSALVSDLSESALAETAGPTWYHPAR